mmetsp:Transcript_5289/g.11507  ORF Transcript_5289/g.11507 Transcript_5289/m.11507 type:complete len:203 (-) Transcript_5289:238-846(-)
MVLTLPLSVLRASDIVVLLAVGAAYEAVARAIVHKIRVRSPKELAMRAELHDLRYETAKKRSLGPSAFVETSKLERAVLAKEKTLTAIETDRNVKIASIEDVSKKASKVLQLIVFLVYWGIPVLSIDGSRVEATGGDDHIVTAEDAANSCMRGICFPFCVWLKIAAMGVAEQASSIGALVVFWSAQTTVRKFAECVEILTVR